jgi:hypothetical protein
MAQYDDASSKARRQIAAAIRELVAAQLPVSQALHAALTQLQAGAFKDSHEDGRPLSSS